MPDYEAIQNAAEHKAAALHHLGWEEGAGAAIWCRVVLDQIEQHELTRTEFVEARTIEVLGAPPAVLGVGHRGRPRRLNPVILAKRSGEVLEPAESKHDMCQRPPKHPGANEHRAYLPYVRA
jgi:hypothetical protein